MYNPSCLRYEYEVSRASILLHPRCTPIEAGVQGFNLRLYRRTLGVTFRPLRAVFRVHQLPSLYMRKSKALRPTDQGLVPKSYDGRLICILWLKKFTYELNVADW